MWICPQCGNQNEGKFCGNCGAEQPAAQTPSRSNYPGQHQRSNAPAAPAPAASPAPTPTTPSAPKPAAEKEKKGHGGMIAVVVVLCIALLSATAAGLYFWLDGQDSGSEKEEKTKDRPKVETAADAKSDEAEASPTPETDSSTEGAEIAPGEVLPGETTEGGSNGARPSAKPDKPTSNNSTTKQGFLDRAEQIETDSTERNEEARSQHEINAAAIAEFNDWDKLLNDVYQYLKKTLPTSEFETLKDEELAWIKEKDEAVEEAAKEWEGGSGEPMARYSTAASYTKERCYELIEMVD